jgi:hypothetical protein
VAPFFVLVLRTRKLYYKDNTDGGEAMKNPVFLLSALMLSACSVSADDASMVTIGSNDLKDGKAITEQATDPGKFTSISAVGPDDVVFKTGDASSISASGSADALKELRFVIIDGNLTVGRYKYRWDAADKDKAVITITAPLISSVSLAGSGNFNGDKLSGSKVAIDLAGSGSAEIADIQSPEFDGDVAGKGNLKLSGKAAKAKYSIAGSGSIDAKSLVSETVDMSVAGSGNAAINATQTVDASIAGSGDVTVSGGAKCKSSVIGSGKLKCG